MSYELTANPYVVGSPVSGEGLYGRQEVFQFVQESLAGLANRVVVLHGQRRVGKSSVLHELHLHRLPPDKYCAVWIDMQGQAGRPFSSVIHDLASHIADPLGMEEPELADYQRDETYFLNMFLPEALARLGERRLVIMTDEFDALAQDENSPSALDPASAGARFVPMLQTILDKNIFDKVVFILVIGCSLEKLPPAFRQLIKGARFSRIWLLSKEDARALITRPAAKEMLTYTEEALERIWNYATGHPYFTQLLCYEVFNRAKRRQQAVVQANDVDQIIDAALESGAPAFAWLWEALSIAERLLISTVGVAAFETSVARKGDIQNILDQNRIRLGNVDLVEAANHLARENVLQFEGQDGYRFEVELVRLWVKKNHHLSQEKLHIAEMSRTAVSDYNVARRSHEKGRLEAAIEGYRLALQANPNHFNAQLGLAQALWDQGNLEEAVKEFESAYWLNAEASREGLVGVRMAMAEALEQRGEYIEAAVHYRRVYELAPEHRPLQERLRILYDKGNQARNREQWTEAAELFERVMEIDPAYEDVRQQLLRILYTQATQAEEVKDWAKAAQFYGRAVDIDPTYQDAVQRRDVAAKKRGQFQPPLGRRWVPIVAIVLVALALLGGIGGWFAWSGLSVWRTPTVTPTQVVAVQITPTPSPTSEATVVPTQEPTLQVTDTPTKVPTPQLSIESTSTPTEEPTPEPTSVATETPTAAPTATPEPPTPTEKPIPTDTPKPVVVAVPLPPGEAFDVEINRKSPTEVFVLLKGGGIYRTRDGGNAWQEIRPAGPGSVVALEIASGNPQVIYGGGYGQLIKSSDGGDNWEVLSLPGQIQVYDLAVAGNNPDVIYAATDGGLLVSRDGGKNWETGQSSGGQALMGAFYAVMIETDKDGPVYAAGEGDAIYRADGPGASWQRLVCQGGVRAIYALAVQGDIVYAGGALASLARSDNRGNDWAAANAGIPDPSMPTLDISRIVLASNGYIYASTGFRATNDNGQGIVWSSDGGATWTRLPLPPGAGNNYYVQGIAVHPTDPRTIYIAGFGGVHKSEDGGQTWVKQ